MKKNENVRKKKEDIKIEKEKGITLVALVVTIVVLLILAGITINAILGPNSIFETARKAGEETNKAVEDEQGGLGNIENWLKEEGWANGAGGNGGGTGENPNPGEDNSIAPRWLEGGEPHSVEEWKTDTQIRLAMTAVDDDSDYLIYTIKYWECNSDGTKGDYIGEKKIEGATQGEEQTANITGLTINSGYCFEVVVSDGLHFSNTVSVIVSTAERITVMGTGYVKSAKIMCSTCYEWYECPRGGSLFRLERVY